MTHLSMKHKGMRSSISTSWMSIQTKLSREEETYSQLYSSFSHGAAVSVRQIDIARGDGDGMGRVGQHVKNI
jgi:hypothetical protein